HHHSHHHSRRPRSRSRSPHRDDDPHLHKRKRHRSRSPPPRPVVLPYKAQKLHKSQYEEFKPLFQSYLDIQKQIHLEDLDEREAKGRWKSFVGRWNRGDLARSWYDPSMLQTAKETISTYRRPTPPTRPMKSRTEPEDEEMADSDDDDFGPAPPRDLASHSRAGPTAPRLDDIAYRDELISEDRSREGMNYRDDIRFERKQDRKAQKDRLEELLPRADPGSRERQLEKKRETTSTLKEFKDAKEAGDAEVGESELMGDDGIDQYKKQKKEMERKKTERELR
ncbi:hypothetical protein BDV96DRAFT_461175, partial [Lophiotrema nucula]